MDTLAIRNGSLLVAAWLFCPHGCVLADDADEYQPTAEEQRFLDLMSGGDLSREDVGRKFAEFMRDRNKSEQAEAEPEQADGDGNRDTAERAGEGDLHGALEGLLREAGPGATLGKLEKVQELAGHSGAGAIDAVRKAADQGEKKLSGLPGDMTQAERAETEVLTLAYRNLRSESEAARLQESVDRIDLAAIAARGSSTTAYLKELNKRMSRARIQVRDVESRAQDARQQFLELNPDLYFGEDAGQTYFGTRRRAVYLPLGERSFADELVDVEHPLHQHERVSDALGAPDYFEASSSDSSGMYSLGAGGTLTVRFTDNALVNVNGPDLYVFEIGAIEPTDLEISTNGRDWVAVGKIDGGVAAVDIAEFVEPGELYQYVRLRDLLSKSVLPGADVDAIAAIGSAIRLSLDSKVLFDSGSSDLKADGVAALQQLVHEIEVIGRGTVSVDGHTDDVGDAASNQALSFARATSVSNELRKLLPQSSYRWRQRGFGEENPLVDNDSDENRALNRRVEITVLPN